jgi:hypothetical protein
MLLTGARAGCQCPDQSSSARESKTTLAIAEVLKKFGDPEGYEIYCGDGERCEQNGGDPWQFSAWDC